MQLIFTLVTLLSLTPAETSVEYICLENLRVRVNVCKYLN